MTNKNPLLEERVFSASVHLGEDAFFLQRSDRLGAEYHGDLLTINFKGFLLKVRLEDTIGATQREANIVAKLLSFSGEFAASCHLSTS